MSAIPDFTCRPCVHRVISCAGRHKRILRTTARGRAIRVCAAILVVPRLRFRALREHQTVCDYQHCQTNKSFHDFALFPV